MGEGDRLINSDGVRIFHLNQIQVLPRAYGNVYLLSAREAGFKNLQMLLMILEAGRSTSKHFHPSEEIFYVIKGKALFISAFESRVVGTQDTIMVPPNEHHQIKNVSATTACEIIISLSPPRKPEQVTYCE